MKIRLVVSVLAAAACSSDASEPDETERFAGDWKAVGTPVRLSAEHIWHSSWMHIGAPSVEGELDPRVLFVDSSQILRFDPARREYGPDFTWSVTSGFPYSRVAIIGDTILFYPIPNPTNPYGYNQPTGFTLHGANELLPMRAPFAQPTYRRM
jgi:hypothetical protein